MRWQVSRYRLFAKLVFVLLMVGMGVKLASAQSADSQSADTRSADIDTFTIANNLYVVGNYQEAANLYQQLIEQGYSDGRLYYNLANAQFQLDNIGEAILNYRRAQLLLPRDSDVRENLTVARQQVVDRIVVDEQSPMTYLAVMGDWLTRNELAALALLCWGVLVGVLLLNRRRPSLVWRTLIYACALLLLLAIAGSYRYYQAERWPPAVVVVSEAPIYSAALGEEEPLFTLLSGVEVTIVARQGQWVELTLPGDRLQGWSPAENVAAVVPPEQE